MNFLGIGAPGEPGLSAAYCPSDCGVNTILSQFGGRAQHPESINGEDNGAPASSNPEEYAQEEPVEAPPAPPAPQPTVQQQKETAAAEESFEETSYRSFFGH